MKILYLTGLDEQDREKCGILGKIRGQINSFERAGIDVCFARFCGKSCLTISGLADDICVKASGKTIRERLASVYDDLFSIIVREQIRKVYIRFTSLDSRAICFYKRLKKENISIIIEFYSHNLELEALKTVQRNIKNRKYLEAMKGLASLQLNRLYFPKLHNYVDRIVTTTPVGDMYGIPTINVVNGIDIASSVIRIKESNSYDFNIISVAMISPWHGYDRIIKGISQYYIAGGTANIRYTVVGDGEERPSLEKLVYSLGLQAHVEFVGIKLNEELIPYYNQADIAIEMLAGFRRTKGHISSIKMAEYFAKGIPVVYSGDGDSYNEEIARYCYRVSNDDSPVNISRMIDFCKSLQSEEKDVEKNMHDIASKYFDWSVTMKDLCDFVIKN